MLKWLVYNENFNARKIEEVNIFNYYSFHKDCIAAAKKYKNDKEQFLNRVQQNLKYYFWSRCEYEIILTSWPSRKDSQERKIDIYDQVMLHWDVFSEWLWENRMELLKKEKKPEEVAECKTEVIA